MTATLVSQGNINTCVLDLIVKEMSKN